VLFPVGKIRPLPIDHQGGWPFYSSSLFLIQACGPYQPLAISSSRSPSQGLSIPSDSRRRVDSAYTGSVTRPSRAPGMGVPRPRLPSPGNGSIDMERTNPGRVTIFFRSHPTNERTACPDRLHSRYGKRPFFYLVFSSSLRTSSRQFHTCSYNAYAFFFLFFFYSG